jgi:Tfp pilus assembly protein PilO
MRSRLPLVVGAVVVVVVVAVWYLAVFRPRGDELDEARTELDAARSEEQSLQAQLEQLQAIDENSPEIDAELGRLQALVPKRPDLASFIVAANEIAVQSGIDWISITPNEPAPGAVGPAEIAMTIQIDGGYFQVLDYLNRLEDLERLVVVDGISISTGGDEGDGSTAQVGAPDLSSSLTARMFSQTALDSTGDPSAGAAGGATTPTTAASAPEVVQ